MQISFSEAEYCGKRKQTRREKFLSEMNRVVPWVDLVQKIERHYPQSGKPGRQPYKLETMLRIHFMQQWFALSDPAMEEALYDIVSMRQFAGLSLAQGGIPDETTILNFRHLLETHGIAQEIFAGVNLLLQEQGLLVRQGTIVDATIIEAPSSTKNAQRQRDPEMHQTKKGKDWRFGMKAHVGVDLHTGLVHSVRGTAANVSDVTQAAHLLHGKERLVFGDAGYQGVEKREEHQRRPVRWHIAVGPSKIAQMQRGLAKAQVELEHMKASLRAKVEHPFRVIKRQFGYTKVRYRGLAKNTAQLMTLFALSNLWIARGHLLAQVRPQDAKST